MAELTSWLLMGPPQKLPDRALLPLAAAGQRWHARGIHGLRDLLQG
jgi:hypothetical protein